MILTSRDWVFIKECIYGGPIAPAQNNHPAVQTLIGRGRAKEWMYDIVSNGHSGLDVDKMDYFARDQRRAFGTSGKIHIQMLEDCYVAWGTCTRPDRCVRCQSQQEVYGEAKHLMICYAAKIETSAMNFFKERHHLHNSIYRHKTVQAVTYMIQDILCLADPFVQISARDMFASRAQAKKEYDHLPMSLAVLDPHVFQRLTDSIIDLIEAQEDVPELAEARALIRRLRCRDLYKCKGFLPISRDDPQDGMIWLQSEQQIKYDLLSIAGVHCDEKGIPHRLEAQDFIVEKCSIHHGSNASNPLNNMRFVQKRDEMALISPWERLPLAVEFNKKKLEASLPETFQSNSIRVFSRNSAKDELLEHVFETWKTNRDAIVTAGPPDLCQPEEEASPVFLSQEDDDFGDANHEMGDNPEQHNNADDGESVDFNVPQNPDGGVPSPSALVSPERSKRWARGA